MNDLSARLTTCFQAVFPHLSVDEVQHASLVSVAEWDSVATVSLITVIEEEFGLQIPMEELENMISFPLILDHLQREVHVA